MDNLCCNGADTVYLASRTLLAYCQHYLPATMESAVSHQPGRGRRATMAPIFATGKVRGYQYVCTVPQKSFAGQRVSHHIVTLVTRHVLSVRVLVLRELVLSRRTKIS